MFDFNLDRISFWVGFAAGLLFYWFARRLRPFIKDMWAALVSRGQAVRAGLTVGIEQRFRQDMLRLAQVNHLAAPLFSVDEVAIQPRLMAPPPPVAPQSELPPDDVFSLTLPYLPDWPEMAATFKAPTLTLTEALEGGAPTT